MLQNRKVLIATMHNKESVIAPILEKNLGAICFTSSSIDTDLLGTFSGEVPRNFDALTTLRKKCDLGHNLTKSNLVVASEGSFGQHPTIFFATANEELLMLKDYENDIEIVAREISIETNFNSKLIHTEEELFEFAAQVNFPSHALLLKSNEKNFEKIFKGITTEEVLLEKYYELKHAFNTVYAETDMRAMFNPTRMNVIENATYKFIEKIKSLCPKCSLPGFDVVTIKSGLPCKNCLFPTRSTFSHIYQCKKCSFEEEKLYPRGIQHEDPTYCDICNP
jgi:hypothetical protein